MTIANGQFADHLAHSRGAAGSTRHIRVPCLELPFSPRPRHSRSEFVRTRSKMRISRVHRSVFGRPWESWLALNRTTSFSAIPPPMGSICWRMASAGAGRRDSPGQRRLPSRHLSVVCSSASRRDDSVLRTVGAIHNRGGHRAGALSEDSIVLYIRSLNKTRSCSKTA